MATYDLEEQEQLDELKAWWKRWGNLTLVGAAIVMAAAAGWRYWQHQAETDRMEAAAVFGKLTQSLQAGDAKTARDVGAVLIDKYPRTAYAPRAALLLGKLNYGNKDVRSAQAQLEWVIANSKEVALKDLARLRLAGILLDEKQYGPAMKQLDSPHSDAFGFRFDDLKGDVLFAQGKNAEARSAYQAAFNKMAAENPYRAVVELKLDGLGGPTQ
jgi:predicted negative regulator of RcsB-dependent stress response